MGRAPLYFLLLLFFCNLVCGSDMINTHLIMYDPFFLIKRRNKKKRSMRRLHQLVSFVFSSTPTEVERFLLL